MLKRSTSRSRICSLKVFQSVWTQIDGPLSVCEMALHVLPRDIGGLLLLLRLLPAGTHGMT